MNPPDLFRFCPACGAPVKAPGANPFRCPVCDLTYFFNPTVAAGAFVFNAAGEALFTRRAKEPAKGKLGIPGGFLDIGESAEDGLRREIREEVALEVTGVRLLCSAPNRYEYKGIAYPVCDLIFSAVAVNAADAQALDEIAGLEWRWPADVDPDEIAFPSMRLGLRILGNTAGTPHPVSTYLNGAKCSLCRQPATHKVAEEVQRDQEEYRHPYTEYVCCEHFRQIMRLGRCSPVELL